jgi:hypothetical protein
MTGAASSLAGLLSALTTRSETPGAPVRAVREDLAAFLRTVEPRVFTARGARQQELRRLLGWDDESLHRFIGAPLVVHSSTHVSMNAFAPMLTFPWFCLRIMSQAARGPGGKPAHLRTQVTHNNLSDSRWKPHVWWRLDDSGAVAKTGLFSQASRWAHQILLCQPVPPVPPAGLAGLDAAAVELAGHATNFAYFAMLYRMSLERACGLHDADGTVEVPIDALNAFSLRGADWPRWRRACSELGLPLRTVTAGNELRPLTAGEAGELAPPDPLDPRQTIVCHNYLNMGQAYRLGVGVTVGAEKMSAYEPEMNRVLGRFFAALGEQVRPPRFLGVQAIALDKLAPLNAEIAAGLERLGGRPSLPLYAAQYSGSLAAMLDRALPEPADALASMMTRIGLTLRGPAGRQPAGDSRCGRRDGQLGLAGPLDGGASRSGGPEAERGPGLVDGHLADRLHPFCGEQRGEDVAVEVGAELAGLRVGDPGEPVLPGRLDGRRRDGGELCLVPGEHDDGIGLCGLSRRVRVRGGDLRHVAGAGQGGDPLARLDLQLGGHVHAAIIGACRPRPRGYSANRTAPAIASCPLAVTSCGGPRSRASVRDDGHAGVARWGR